MHSPLSEYSCVQFKASARQNNEPQLCWLHPDRIGCNWMAGEREARTKMSVCLNVLRRDLKSGMLPRLISLNDAYNWVWMHDINTEPGFYSHVNWHQNAQLFCPLLLEGKQGKLHLAYCWGRRIDIEYIDLEDSSIIGKSS